LVVDALPAAGVRSAAAAVGRAAAVVEVEVEGAGTRLLASHTEFL